MYQTWHKYTKIAIAACLCLVSTACMEPQTFTPTRPASTFDASYRTQVLQTSDFPAAFAAAEGVVIDYLKIDSSDPNQGLITFAPTDYSGFGGARMRRIGRLALHKVGANIVASIQIEIQKDATQTMRAMRQQSSPDDRPGTTPIQGEGGLTPSQAQYWDTLRRDTKMESEILQRISDALGQVSSATSQPAANTAEQSEQPAPASSATPALAQ